MAAGTYRFDRFCLDASDRRLTRDGAPVEINARYLDALALLVGEQGRLVSKERFHDEVWRGVPVTDEALTQCIRTLRRQLGDDATRPRFIETVPKHGYRFIAPVEAGEAETGPSPMPAGEPVLRFFLLGLAGMIGGAVAGVFTGLLYGFGAASGSLQSGIGAVSVLLVMLCLSVFAGLVGGAGVGFGIAAAEFAPRARGRWSIAGGAAGGMVMGAFAKLLGLDVFDLLFGRTPGDITGAAEGALIGLAVGLAAWVASRGGYLRDLRRTVATAAAAGACAGLLIPIIGGRMFGGSLDSLADRFPNSRFRLDPLGSLFGEDGFGLVSQSVTGAVEGLLFAACVLGAMLLARKSLEAKAQD